ncbi:MAG: UDP-2,3-diacylglucosamine diphosphatase [Burkholderiales bacterium]|nr:UDP-2,3-diacylglucosamine diphosphatase [Burkholderiales bacterium]
MQLSSLAPSSICKRQIPALTKPVFVADIHLSDLKPKTQEAFLDFLKRHAERFNELVILGDLFEFWAGDDQMDQVSEVIEALRDYHSHGHNLYVMHGNRDFLLGADFENETGAVLISDPICTQVSRERVLLSHGDAWCTKDTEYQQFRQVLRNPETQLEVLKETLENRMVLANAMRANSMDDSKKKAPELMDVVVSEIAKIARQTNSPTIIHGHTHKVAHHTHVIDDFRFDRWVLPDWNFDNGKQDGGYLSYEDGYLHFAPLT